MKSHKEHKVICFRSLENFKEDGFSLELSTMSRCWYIIKRIAKHLSLSECPKMGLTSHNPYSGKPDVRPARHDDMLSDMCKKSNILYYKILGSRSVTSQLSRALNITFHDATKNEVSVRCISDGHHKTVSDVLNELKSEVEQFPPSAKLRLLEIDHNRISKIYPLNENLKNLKNQSSLLRAEKIPEEEEKLGLDDKIIHVCHFTKEALPGKRNKLNVRYFGEPFFLIIHKGETLAEIKLRIKKKLQVPDDEFSKWKFAQSKHSDFGETLAETKLRSNKKLQIPDDEFSMFGETLAEITLCSKKKSQVPDEEFSKWNFAHCKHAYFQDSDILFKHFQTIKDLYALDSTFLEEYLGLEHPPNFLNTTFTTNQLEEEEMLVQHSLKIFPKSLPRRVLLHRHSKQTEVAQAQIVSTMEYQTLKDPPSTRFTWTIENFSRLNNTEHYSNIFLADCYKWRVMIFPKGNNVDHFSVYLNTAESFSLLYAEFSLVIVNQTHKEESLRKDIRHQFTPGQSSGGIASFMPLSELNNTDNGYIVGDTCIIEAEVSLAIPIENQKLGLPDKESLCETIGVVEETCQEAQKVEKVPEPAISNVGAIDAPSTQSGKKSMLEEDQMLVQHSLKIGSKSLSRRVLLHRHSEQTEMGQAQINNPMEYETLKDPPSTRFTWTIKNFSRLNSKEHYSSIFLGDCYKWRIMIFPKGNGDHFAVYLNTAESFSLLYAEFSLVVANQTHKKDSLRKDIRHQFTPGQSSGGIASFMPLSELNNPDKGYIVNDTCIIEAEVSLAVPIKKQKLGIPRLENTK